MSNITYTCAGWAGNWVRGNTSAGPPWSGQKIGAFLCRELQNDNWCGINHTTPHFAPHQVEVNNSTVSQHGTTCFLPRQFSHGSRCCVSCSVAAPPSHPSSQQQPRGWAGWAGRAGLVTEKQQNARVEAEGGWMEWYSEGWET